MQPFKDFSLYYNKGSKICVSEYILMANEICREYCASRSREAAYFLMRLCASLYTERSVFLTASISPAISTRKGNQP